MPREIMFILLGYLSGSILYARLWMRLFHREDALQNSRDGNPGTANAFQYGGFLCGVLTLLCDLMKGFLPVFLYLRSLDAAGNAWLSLILAAPVLGHVFPVFSRFRGGKGIATTFGVLLGLLPEWLPAAALAVPFILFSTVVRICPHRHRTQAAYLLALLGMLLVKVHPCIAGGFLLIALIVWIRLAFSREPKESMQVKLLWMH